jgi:hypothetical protein
MKTKTIELYEFEELPADVQEKVLDNERRINVEDVEWYDFLFEEWKEKLEKKGFKSPDISFSGFSYQGDGASFTCKNVDIPAFVASLDYKGKYTRLLSAIKDDTAEVNASVVRVDFHYSHENTVGTSVEVLSDDDKVVQLGQDLDATMTQVVRKLSQEIYKELESEYDGLLSDEAVKDTILANEYTFTINGKMENV